MKQTFSTQGDIDRTRPDPSRELYLHDEKRSHLVVRVSPKGARTFYFYRTDPTRKGGTAKERIGPVGEWTLEQARAKVDILNGRTVEAGGVVPQRERRGGATLGDACRDYMAWHVASGGRSDRDHQSIFKLYLEPHEHVPIDAIDDQWVERNVKFAVANAKGLDKRRAKLRRSGGTYAANKVLSMLSSVFTRYLKVNKLAGKRMNPCLGVEPFPKSRREECLRGDEIHRFIAALDTFKREHGYYKHTRPGRKMFKGEPIESRLALADVLFVALVTGQRRGAVAGMKWSDLRLSNGEPTWRIPPEKGNKSRVVKTVALHAKVLDLLRERRKRIGDTEFVFAGARGANRAVDPRKVFRKVLAIAGIDNPDLRMHDLRAAFVTLGIASGKNLEAISQAVGHSDIATTRHYARLSDEQKRNVATGIGDLMFPKALEEEAA
jgi:integrase